MLKNLSKIQRGIAYLILGIGALFFWSYLSSALFFSFLSLPESELRPWSIIEYFQHGIGNPNVKAHTIVSILIPPLMVVIMFLLSFIKIQSIYGDARFSNQNEIRKAGLLGGKGILLGKRGSNFISDDGTEHVLVSAPSRSGKGVGIVIPNLLNWDSSVVVLDIKMENFRATSGFREKHGHKIYLFNPADIEGKTHSYNPLMVVSENPSLRINEIQKISNFLAPSPQDSDPMWSSEARKLFLATVLFLQDTGEHITLGKVYRFVNGNSSEEIQSMMEEHIEDLDPACINNFKNYVGMGAKQRSGVKSTLTSALDLFDNPLIDAATSKSDFSFADLRKKRISIYVGVTPNNLSRLKPLLNLFFQQCIDQNTQSLPDKKTEPYKILMLMDEFISLGRMDIIKDGIAFFAGYHIRLMPIIQGPSQLADKYGDAGKRTMISNFKFRVVYAPNDPLDAEELSRELGTKTVNQKSQSRTAFKSQGGSTTTSKTGRALLLPQEIKRLSDKKEIIIIEAMFPIMADKIIYYHDKAFSNRFYNVFDPSKNKGPLPSRIPITDINSAMDARKVSISLSYESENRSTNNVGESMTQSNNDSNKIKLSDNEMDDLLTEFWNTGN